MLRKLVLGVVVFIIILMAAVIAVPLLFKDQIVAKVKTVINDNLTATVNFGDFDVSIIRSFPDLSFTLKNLTIAGTDTFKNDTLANIKELYVRIDIMTVIKGEPIQIKSFTIDDAKIVARVLKNGKANWDIVKPDTSATTPEDTSTTAFTIGLQKYALTNVDVIYDDASLGVYTRINDLNHSGTGDFTQDLFTLNTTTTAKELTVAYENVAYLNKATVDIQMPLEIDLKNSRYTFKETAATLNELKLAFSGVVEMPTDDIKLDVKFDAKKSDLKHFLSLIPAIYSSSFADLKTSGNFALEGYAKGIYNEKSMPGFGVNLLIEDGQFKYPSLPTAVNNVQVKTSITNPNGDLDKTVVDVSIFHIELGNEPFDARLLLQTPISDPAINAMLKGKIDLAAITKIIPIEGTTLKGIFTANIAANGRMSSIDKGRYDEFDASGQASLINFEYASKDMPMPVAIKQTQMSFNPKNINLLSFDAKIGKSDFKADGKLENYLAYALKGEPIAGKLNLSSSLIDVNELMGPETTTTAPTTSDTAALTVIEIPANIDFVLTSSIQKVLYDNLVLDNVQGKITVRNSTLSFDNVALKTLDGTVTLNGAYATPTNTKPKVNMVFGIQNMNIQKAFNSFNTIQKLAPVGKNTTGNFSTKLSFSSDLGTDMSPIMNSIYGEGALDLIKVVIEGSDLMNKLGDALKNDKIKRLDLNNTRVQFKIADGRITVNPFDVKTGNALINIGGSNGLDQTLDYLFKFQLPRNSFGSAANGVLDGLVAKANSSGATVSLGETVNVNALVGGTFTKPTIKLDMSNATNAVKSAVKDIIDNTKKQLEDKAKAEGERLKGEASAKARAQADKILADAQQKADAIKREAANLADKVRKEGAAQAQNVENQAKNPIAKKGAKIAADKIRKEADEKANGIVNEGNRNADNVMNAARNEANKILSTP